MADEKTNVVSMLDLQADTEEIMGFNPEADANQLLPPIPEGTYWVHFRFTEQDPEKRALSGLWGSKTPQKVIYTSVTLEVYNSEGGVFDGRLVRDNLVSTMVRQQTGTCSMQGVIQCINGRLDPSIRTRAQLWAALCEAVGEDGAASGQVDITWEAAENLTEEERDAMKRDGKKPFRVRGAKNFPKDDQGNPIPEVTHNGETYRAFNSVSRYITAGTNDAPIEEAPVVQAPAPTQRVPQARPVAQAPVAPQAPQAPQAPAGPPVPQRTAPRAGAPAPRATAPRAPQAPRQ